MLAADGTVRVGALTLRRPTLRDLRDLRENLPGPSADDDDRARWVADAVRRLGGVDPDPDGLPGWCADPSFAVDVLDHWRHVPAGPWRRVGRGEVQGGPLAGLWFAEFAGLYEALAARGIGPRDADGLEVWEVASVLGVLTEASAPERDYIAERVAAAKSGAPPPVAGPPGPGLANLMGRVPPKR